jgi:hypothetical protein
MRFFIDQWASLSNILYMRPMRLLVNLKNNKKEWRADKACGPGLEDCRISVLIAGLFIRFYISAGGIRQFIFTVSICPCSPI